MQPAEAIEAKETSRIVVVQAAIVEASRDARLRLEALRDIMHRVLNAAISEWHRADKRPSTRDPKKETLDRGSVTAAVKAQLERERGYWTQQIPRLELALEKAQQKIGRARAKDSGDTPKLEQELKNLEYQLERAKCRATLLVPSAIYDTVVQFTAGKYVEYKKAAFRGERSNPTFREGQPIRWRDGQWSIRRTKKKGAYELTVPLHGTGREIERATFTIIPDGPAMYGWLKRMTEDEELQSGAVKQCDMRLVYSDKKKQWFAKLTGRFSYTKPASGTRTAAIRRGRKSAFVIVFDDGYCQTIEGHDVIAFKNKIKARKTNVQRHLRSLELGSGGRGHGKKRRMQGLRRIDDSEARFIDTRCKTWAAQIVRLLRKQQVGRLFAAKSNTKEFLDSVTNEVAAAYLRQWPFAKSADRLASACEINGIVIEEIETGLNARRCPQCKHEHLDAQNDTFTCEICGLKRPSDQILAWNMLVDAVGAEPIQKNVATEKKMVKALKKLGETSDKEQRT